jgi:hypothetical protein
MKMSDYYYVNRHSNMNGKHQIHAGRCHQLPNIIHRRVLGLFDHPDLAIAEANRQKYGPVETCLCKHCMEP